MSRILVTKGKAQLWEGDSLLEEFPCVVGKGGIGPKGGEGDGITPIGTYALGPVFGFAAAPPVPVKIKYIQIHERMLVIDDPESKYYNQIVDREEIADPDWNSAEEMGKIPQYEVGVVIRFNMPAVPFKGSAIFLHLWESPRHATQGCIGLSRENVLQVISWIDAETSITI